MTSKSRSMIYAGVLLASLFALLTWNYNAAAQQTAKRESAVRWEYCAVTYSGSYSDGFSSKQKTNVVYMSGGGSRSAQIDGEPGAVIGKLGSEGWEMVGQGRFYFNSQEEQPAVYFKRPSP